MRLLTTLTLLCSLACTAPASAETEEQRLVEVLALRPGSTVADVGAGNGKWAVRLADQVGPEGKVFATEVTDELVGEIENRVERAGLRNIEVVLGSQEATGLEPRCCDAILLRMVYHHFEDPQTLRRDLFAALRPGGRLVLVETDPQRGWSRLDGVPERGGHGIRLEELEKDFTRSGFELVRTIDPWPGGNGDPYCTVFHKPTEN